MKNDKSFGISNACQNNVVITQNNIQKFTKRLQKQLKEQIAPELKLHQASLIIAKTLGFSSIHEMNEILSKVFPNNKETTSELEFGQEFKNLYRDFCNKIQDLSKQDENIVSVFLYKNAEGYLKFVLLSKDGEYLKSKVLSLVDFRNLTDEDLTELKKNKIGFILIELFNAEISILQHIEEFPTNKYFKIYFNEQFKNLQMHPTLKDTNYTLNMSDVLFEKFYIIQLSKNDNYLQNPISQYISFHKKGSNFLNLKQIEKLDKWLNVETFNDLAKYITENCIILQTFENNYGTYLVNAFETKREKSLLKMFQLQANFSNEFTNSDLEFNDLKYLEFCKLPHRVRPAYTIHLKNVLEEI